MVPIRGPWSPARRQFRSRSTRCSSALSQLKASDLHVTAGSHPAVRVHGHIERLDDFPVLDPDTVRELIYRITTTEQQKHLELNRQLDFAYGVRGLARFRVNAYYQRESLAAAFRMIPTEIKSVEELGLPSSLHELTTKPRGLVLVTGPTGSGKSTTLASLIDEINRTRTDHIITIEDPIEFLHQHKSCIVNQREIGARRDRLRRRAARRPPPGPRRDPPRRDARPRDDRDGADRRRDRPPRVRDAPHPERAEHDRPRSSTSSRRRSRTRSACSSPTRCRASSRRRCCRRRTARAACAGSRSSSSTTPSAT